MKKSVRQWLAGLLVALICAGVLSGFASTHPDGLEWVAEELGFGGTAAASVVEDWPLAGYGFAGIENEALAGGVAGLIGTILVLGAATGVTFLVRGKTNRVAG